MLYGELTIPQNVSLCEKIVRPYDSLSERHIQALWHEQKFFNNLTTTEGEAIFINSPGIWNGEAGPDFLKAHLQIGEQSLHGDIELHLMDSSWFHHRHHCDSRYNDVILHIALWQPTNAELPITTHEGRKVYQAYLEPALQVDAQRLPQLIDLDLYPYRRFLGSGRCAQALFQKLPKKKIKNFFQEAAQWRLSRKYNLLRSLSTEPSKQLACGIAMALGYKNNAYLFLDLFKEGLKKAKEGWDEESLFAYFLGHSGFFSSIFSLRWQESTYYTRLQRIWQQSPRASFIRLHLNNIRPANHPVRRLAYLAKLCSDRRLHCYWEQIMHLWKTGWHLLLETAAHKKFKRLLHNSLPAYKDLYWSHHYTFEKNSQTTSVTLLGNQLGQTILINTVLPLLWGEVIAGSEKDELTAFLAFYSSLPAQETHKSAYLQHRFFGDTAKGDILNSCDMQQGAYQLHYDFCLHYEASCDGCPFVERFEKIYF